MILLLGIYLAAFVLDSPASIIVLVAACVLEPFEIAFLRNWSKRIGRRTKATTGAEGMIGKRAEVVRECRPIGTVRIGSELWEARCEEGAAPGDEVRVDSVEELTLVVSRQAAAADSSVSDEGTPRQRFVAVGDVVSAASVASSAAKASGVVLMTLAVGQFVMALDTTVMNTAIATVANDLDTTVTGIQTAITLYTLVMASLMITGGKVGEIIGRKRAFSIGCVIYACGSLTTALAPNLTVLIIGWSFLEGFGAVLIMPAIVALVASNFGRADRPRAYGLVAAAGAIACAVGPVIGGLFTTYWSWRWVFAGEVLIVAVILLLARRMKDTPPEKGVKLDLVGTALSAGGLGLIVFGILRSGSWGFVQPKDGAPEWLGLSPVIWLMLGGGALLVLFAAWENRRLA